MKLLHILSTGLIAATTTVFASNDHIKQDNLFPAKAIVGYVKGYSTLWNTQPETDSAMIKAAANKGYNVFVYAFGGQDQANTPYLQFSDAVKADLTNQLKIIHQADSLAILSVGGGENNTFEPDLSDGKAASAGKAMADFLADKGFDGFDIDVEHPNTSTTEANLLQYLAAMREEYKAITHKPLIITAAPQISGWYGSGSWPSGSANFAEPIYTQNFMNQAKLDAVFIQTYNQYGGAQFGGLKGYEVGFLSYTFKLLSPETRDDMPGIPEGSFYVPQDTKIILGVPDFKDPSISDAEYITGACLATAMCSGVGLYKPSDILQDISQGGLQQYSQYGGLMTWLLNSDAYQNWQWIDGVLRF